MSWEDLLAPDEPDVIVLPWIEGKKVHSQDRTWTIKGRRPKEHGWYKFSVTGNRTAALLGEAEDGPDDWVLDEQDTVAGYLAGDRFIADDARVDPDPETLVEQTEPVYCIEPGLERFSRIEAFRDREGRLVYIRQGFPLGPEEAVTAAYQDRENSISQVKGVPPALDLAFLWETWQRELAKKREREAEARAVEVAAHLAEEERVAQWRKDTGTGVGRRDLAQRDFKAAAKAALEISGAELLDCRESANKGEMVVQYRFRGRRLECVCSRYTLRIIDAGVCLVNHDTGEKGDTRVTLESLPSTIGEAMDKGVLVVWRHY